MYHIIIHYVPPEDWVDSNMDIPFFKVYLKSRFPSIYQQLQEHTLDTRTKHHITNVWVNNTIRAYEFIPINEIKDVFLVMAMAGYLLFEDVIRALHCATLPRWVSDYLVKVSVNWVDPKLINLSLLERALHYNFHHTIRYLTDLADCQTLKPISRYLCASFHDHSPEHLACIILRYWNVMVAFPRILSSLVVMYGCDLVYVSHVFTILEKLLVGDEAFALEVLALLPEVDFTKELYEGCQYYQIPTSPRLTEYIDRHLPSHVHRHEDDLYAYID